MKKHLLFFALLILHYPLTAQFIEIDKGQVNSFNSTVLASTATDPISQTTVNASPPSSGDVDPFLAEQLQYVLDSLTSQLGAVGLSGSMILPNGTIWNGASGIHNLNNSPITTEMRLGMGSVSKTMTAAVTMQLVEEGLLTLEDTIGKWLPQYPNVDLGIPVRMLLNHTSGIYNFTNNPAFSTYLNQNLSAFIDNETVMNSWVDVPSFPPGTNWGYSNTNYVLLGLIIEAVTGHEFHEEIRNRLIIPNQLNSMYLHPQELPTGPVSNLWIDLTGDGVANDFTNAGLSDVGLFSATWAAGAYMTTPEDLAHWIKYLMTGEVVEPSTVDDMMETYTINSNFHYGLGIYNTEVNGNQWWGHDGYIYYQTLAMYSPDLDVSMVLICNDGLFQNMGLIYFALIQAYLDYEPVAVDENSFSEADIAVFPNPVSHELSVAIEGVRLPTAELSILNYIGQPVFHNGIKLNDGNHVLTIENCDQWPNGVYTIQLETGDGVIVERFVKL